MAETTAFFHPLLEMFAIPHAQSTEFFIKLEKSENFLHVQTDIDELLKFGLATFSSYRGTYDNRSPLPDWRLVVNVSCRDGQPFMVASNGLEHIDDDDDFTPLAQERNWRDLGLHLTRSRDTTFHQAGILFLLMEQAYKGTDRFNLYTKEREAA